MIKHSLLVALFLVFGINSLFSQAKNQISFGAVGAAWEIPVASDVTVGPGAYTNFDFNYFIIGAKANFYFDRLWNLKDPWDVYGGANAGFGLTLQSGQTSTVAIGLQIGGRWFWDEKWGLYLEAGGGYLGGMAGLGVTLVL